MEEAQLKAIASQLRQPSGEFGKQIGENMNIGNAAMNRFSIAALQVADYDRLLEIGMGNGFFVKDILSENRTATYTGCDFSGLMAQEASKINDAFVAEGRASFVVNDGETLPFPNAAFDKIFTVNTIYFWQDPDKVLAEIARVLQPNGQLFICFRPKHLMQHYPFTQYGFNLFSDADVKLLLNRNGFVTSEVLYNPEPAQEFGGKKIETASVVIIAKRQNTL